MASDACCTPAPPAQHTAGGKFESVGGLKSYVNKPASATKAIILIPDVFGFDVPLVLKLADKVAASGYYAIVPDFFHGDPFVVTDLVNPFSTAPAWVAKHHPDASVEDAKAVIKEMKAQGIEAVGASGFCWGARLVATLAKDDSEIKAGVLLHPTLTAEAEIEKVKIPLAILAAEFDEYVPPPFINELKSILESNHIPTFVKIFEGQKHGWTTRYDVSVPHQVQGAEEAKDDMLEFFRTYL